jgi:hypothetical protein
MELCGVEGLDYFSSVVEFYCRAVKNAVLFSYGKGCQKHGVV